MKNSILLLLLITGIAIGCKTAPPTIGMSESDFKKHYKPTLVKANDSISIYKVAESAAWHFNPQTMFYYFKNGKLVEMNEGQRSPDIIVEKRDR